MHEVPLTDVSLAPYGQVLGDERMARLQVGVGRLRRTLGDRTVWNINSTKAGGGVAELIAVLAPLARANGLDVRWLVVDGDPAYYAVAKRLVSRLYGIALAMRARSVTRSGSTTSGPSTPMPASSRTGSVPGTWWSCTTRRPPG